MPSLIVELDRLEGVGFELGVRLCFSELVPSLDNALGVCGGVLFIRGNRAAPSVSLMFSRWEDRDDSAEAAESPEVGVVGVVEG